MAAKVNKTVVVALILGVVCVVAGVMFLMTFVLRSGADLAAQGDRLMAAEKWEEAASSYSKAVNKDQNKLEYIRKWAEALSKQTPASLQAYTDRYRQWLATQRMIANILRVDPAAHKVVLDMVVRDARMSPRAGPVWQQLESDSSDIITRMKSEPEDKVDQIRRYRGIATVGKMGQALEVSAEDRKRAKEDLIAAMKSNPSDALAAVYYADLMRLNADKLRQTGSEEDSDLALAEGLALIQDFFAKNPTSTVARLGLLQLEVADLTSKARKNPASTAEYQAQMKPKMESLLATLESEDPKNVDEFVATQVLDIAVREKVDNAVARGVKVYEKIAAARPSEPFARLMMARFRATTDSPREAADEFKKITELPNQPVSPEGLSLFGVRDSAAIQRCDALIAMTEKQKNPSPERAAALAETKTARDELRTRATIDDSPKTLIDAKIALLSNDSAEARKLLSQYHQATSFSDASALFLSAGVLYQQGLKGESKTMLQRIVDKRVANPAVYTMLARIDMEMNALPSALNWVELALQQAPNDAALLDLKDRIVKGIQGVNNTDPLGKAIAEARAALMLTPPDVDVARSKATLALSLCVKAEDFANVAQMLRRCGRTEGLNGVNRGLEKFPADPLLLSMKARFEVEDPAKEEIERIDGQADMTPIDKALRKYMVYGQTGNMAEANKHLDIAAGLDPEHPLVVASLFERALVARDFEKATVLAQKAKEKNLDKVEGRIYFARLSQAQGKFAEAITPLERATELDSLNPLTWRYLGTAYIATGDKGKALRAFDRSLQIKPDDVTSIITRIQCMMSMDRTADALAAAKEASRLGISNPLFVQMWLLLEFRAGDKDLALERRAFIMRTQPDNYENALEFAKNLIEVGKLDQAREVIDSVEKTATAPDVKKNLEQSLGMLKAALRGARGDTAGALADFEKIAETIPESRREGAYIEFSNIISTFTKPGPDSLVIKVLDAARKYQDFKAADGKAENPPAARVDRMLGDIHFGASEWDEARAAYSRARDAIPVDEEKLLLKRIIECYMKAKQFDEARKLIDVEGGDKSSDLQILLLASQLELARGNKSKSIELLDRAQSIAPNNYLPYRQRAVQKMEDPRTIDDAIVDLELAVGLEPRNTDLVVLLTRACLRKGDVARAMSSLDKGLAIQPDSAALRNEQIQLWMGQNKTKEALDACDAALKADPTNTRWALLKGVIYQRMNEQRNAALEYEKAWSIRKGVDTGKALADALIGAYDLSNPKEAGLLDRAKTVIDDPAFRVDDEPMCKLSRVALNVRQNRKNEAIDDLRAVINNPGLRLGDTQTGSFVIDELRRATGGDMKQVNAMLQQVQPATGWPDMFRVTIARAELGDPASRENGMSELEALCACPDKVAAGAAASTLGANKYLDAVAAAKKPNNEKEVERLYEQAVKAFQTGLAIDPEVTELNNNLAFVLARGLNRPADALPFALRAAQKDGNNPNILDTLGVIYLQLNDANKSEETLTRALAAATDAPTRTMPLIHMIEVKLKKNDKAAAEDLFRELKNIETTDPRVKANYSRDIEEIGKRMQTTP